MEYDTYVIVEGEEHSLNFDPDIEFVNVEEDISGRDLITFSYKGKIKKSFGIQKPIYK